MYTCTVLFATINTSLDSKINLLFFGKVILHCLCHVCIIYRWCDYCCCITV